jgi:hypothetical protein
MVVALIGLAFVGLCFEGVLPNYSNGARVGVVNKFSKVGVVYKSYEGELLMALPAGVSAAQQPEKFEFSVDPDDAATIAKVNDAMNSGKRMSLQYREYFLGPFRYSTDYVVIDVKPTE